MADIDNHYGAYADLRAMGESRPALAELPEPRNPPPSACSLRLGRAE